MAQRQDDLKAAERRERLQMIIGGILGVLVIAGAVLAIVLTAGGDEDDAAAGGDDIVIQAPTANIQDLDQAVKRSGCELRTGLESEGRDHAEKQFTKDDYKTNPPTSGIHFPEWYEDGIYEGDSASEIGKQVHALEHGRINIQYKPGTDAKTIGELEELLSEFDEGYHQLLFPNNTDMPYAIAATAWTQLLGCDKASPEAYDAIRAFRLKYIDKGPEVVP
jgi:hypothetical protein